MDGDTSPAHTTGPVQRQNTKADLHFEHSSPFHKGVLNAIFTGPPKITMLSATLFSPFVNLLLAERRPKPTKQHQHSSAKQETQQLVSQ